MSRKAACNPFEGTGSISCARLHSLGRSGNKKSGIQIFFRSNSTMVRAERLELSHLTALDPKSSVSTNFTTPA